MADYFTFEAGSPYLVPKLTTEEIVAIRTWQNPVLTYEFSFHTLHEAGWPVYIIEEGQHGQRNRPKINIKDKTSNQAVILEGEFADNNVGTDARQVMVANWAVFQKLARLFYEGAAPPPVVVLPRYVAEYGCQTANCHGRIVTQEISSLASLANPVLQTRAKEALGKCKVCRQTNWAFVRTRPLTPPEQPNLPLSQVNPVTQI